MKISLHEAVKHGFELWEVRVDGVVKHTYLSYEYAKTQFDRMVAKMHREAELRRKKELEQQQKIEEIPASLEWEIV